MTHVLAGNISMLPYIDGATLHRGWATSQGEGEGGQSATADVEIFSGILNYFTEGLPALQSPVAHTPIGTWYPLLSLVTMLRMSMAYYPRGDAFGMAISHMGVDEHAP
jgi:hypothetical protein